MSSLEFTQSQLPALALRIVRPITDAMDAVPTRAYERYPDALGCMRLLESILIGAAYDALLPEPDYSGIATRKNQQKARSYWRTRTLDAREFWRDGDRVGDFSWHFEVDPKYLMRRFWRIADTATIKRTTAEPLGGNARKRDKAA